MRRPDARFDIAPYDFAAAARLAASSASRTCSRRCSCGAGWATRRPRARSSPPRSRTRSRPSAACARPPRAILGHVGRRSRITVHGDYDVDGVSSTAILVRALRTLGADVDWYLPSRIDDGYGLAAATVERLAARGTDLLVTVDCAITAVEEVAAARAAGIDVVVTDHHAPARRRRAARRPDRAPARRRLPVPGPVRGGRRLQARAGADGRRGEDPALADEDLDLVALATVADVVPLRGENRRLVRAGLRRARRHAQAGPARADGRRARRPRAASTRGAIGFRLAPRINAAGRLHRADAGLELLLTGTPSAPARSPPSSTRSTPSAATSRPASASRPRRWSASRPPERRPTCSPPRAGIPGVIGIVAARIAERHYRPTVLIALDGDEGTGSGRSIPGFDLLGRPTRRRASTCCATAATARPPA